MVELLQVKVVNSSGTSHFGSASRGGESGGFTFHGNKSGGDSGDEDEDDGGNNENTGAPSKMTSAEYRMTEILTAKRREVLLALIDLLGPKNKDFEKCLGAQTIILELADSSNEKLFGKMIESANLNRLIMHSCDIKNVN